MSKLEFGLANALAKCPTEQTHQWRLRCVANRVEERKWMATRIDWEVYNGLDGGKVPCYATTIDPLIRQPVTTVTAAAVTTTILTDCCRFEHHDSRPQRSRSEPDVPRFIDMEPALITN